MTASPLFSALRKLDNGARFYTADLHVHSYGSSHDVTDTGMTVEAIVDAAAKNGLSLLAITDHNSAKTLKQAVEFGEKYAGTLLVLPGVEISTANGHLLVYFAPEHYEKVQLLLGSIRLQGPQGAQESHTAMSMADVIHEADRLGGVSIAAHVDRQRTGFETLADGYPNWKRDILLSRGLYGMEFDEPSNRNWFSPDDDASPAGSERKRLFQARRETQELSGRPHLAALQGSDAHSLNDFESQLKDRVLTRLKMAELSFDGFRTALVDPEARVRMLTDIPLSFPRVRALSINGGFLSGTQIHLSDNLTCFIGGRGAGKSTALRSLAYGLGEDDSLDREENCPDSITVYCEGQDGVMLRYERARGGELVVKAREDGSLTDVPPDSFSIEFYQQGDLNSVAKDPVGNPALLQEFLDRHLVLSDLRSQEAHLIITLRQNSAQLIPLEASAAQLEGKNKELASLNMKLKVAEEGDLKQVASIQGRLASERSLADALSPIGDAYLAGISLADFKRDFQDFLSGAGDLTGDPKTEEVFREAEAIIDDANRLLSGTEANLNLALGAVGGRLNEALSRLTARHKELAAGVNARIAEFRKQGLSGDLQGLKALISQRSRLAAEVARIKGQGNELASLRRRRTALRGELAATRAEITERRKSQIKTINPQLKRSIRDYHVNIFYDSAGVTTKFRTLFLRIMQGTHFQQEAAEEICKAWEPSALVDFLREGDRGVLGVVFGEQWVTTVVERFGILQNLHELELVDKPARPVIKVITKGGSPRQIPASNMSNGQKNTILLTIAMLSDSRAPLLIDQPEDDLDNAFIFASVVKTLRSVKERRQVVLVTHNANIAVLGDAELILPMRMADNLGGIYDRGSIDRVVTRDAVQEILEGGEAAFRRRKEIYGH